MGFGQTIRALWRR